MNLRQAQTRILPPNKMADFFADRVYIKKGEFAVCLKEAITSVRQLEEPILGL